MKLDRITIENDESFLRQVSSDIDFFNDDFHSFIKELKYYCKNNAVYALASVQIGIPKRLIYVKNTQQNMDNNTSAEYDENIIYINPMIISKKGLTKFLEGCQSCICKEDGKELFYVGIIDRPYQIEIEYFDINGNKQNKVLEGFEATVFEHEYDHLNGILHMDKAKEIFKMSLEEMKDFRIKHPYEIISKD